jgi:hypothetical protein
VIPKENPLARLNPPADDISTPFARPVSFGPAFTTFATWLAFAAWFAFTTWLAFTAWFAFTTWLAFTAWLSALTARPVALGSPLVGFTAWAVAFAARFSTFTAWLAFSTRLGGLVAGTVAFGSACTRFTARPVAFGPAGLGPRLFARTVRATLLHSFALLWSQHIHDRLVNLASQLLLSGLQFAESALGLAPDILNLLALFVVQVHSLEHVEHLFGTAAWPAGTHSGTTPFATSAGRDKVRSTRQVGTWARSVGARPAAGLQPFEHVHDAVHLLFEFAQPLIGVSFFAGIRPLAPRVVTLFRLWTSSVAGARLAGTSANIPARLFAISGGPIATIVGWRRRRRRHQAVATFARSLGDGFNHVVEFLHGWEGRLVRRVLRSQPIRRGGQHHQGDQTHTQSSQPRNTMAHRFTHDHGQSPCYDFALAQGRSQRRHNPRPSDQDFRSSQ